MEYGPIATHCPICGKLFVTMWQEFWPQKRGKTMYCSEDCMMVDMTRDLKTMNEVHRRRKEAKEMINRKITLAQKKRAVEIAISGGNPLEYLKDCGSKKPDGLWYTIKANLKETDPETFAKIPDLRGKTRGPQLMEAPVIPPAVTAEERAEIRQEIAEQEKRFVEKEYSRPMDYAAVFSRVIRYGRFSMVIDQITHQRGRMRLTANDVDLELKAEEWIALTYEIRTALKQMGLVRE